jgi:predicted SprT family Zn-dependent metalloprotease
MKHTIEEIRAEFDRLDDICMIDTKTVPIKISTRATSRYGSCNWVKEGKKIRIKNITISDFILDCEDQFWDTIRHEYAHCLVALRTGKNHGHDAVWKKACVEVGCIPDRLARNQEARIMAHEKRSSREKYCVTCLECGRSWNYLRAGNVVKLLLEGKKTCTCPCGSHEFSLRYL